MKYDEPIFAAKLTPYRSLGRTGFVILMGGASFSLLTSGLLFWMAGAWPVMIFLLLDIVLLWLAFKLNYYSARAHEEIAVWPHEVELKKFAPSGKVSIFSFNPDWTRFTLSRHAEAGITKMMLCSREQVQDIGSFLNPNDKESFAEAFSRALARAKQA